MENLLGGFLDQREEANKQLQEGVEIHVLADEFQEEGINFEATFLNPQPGESWVLKALPNVEGDGSIQGNIGYRQMYKKLPDPDRPGKTFRYISSGSAQTCPVLQLFFDTHAKEKAGDLLAEAIRKTYLASSQEGVIFVQVIQGPKPEDTGKIRMISYHNSGENAHVANLIKNKLAPKNKRLKSENIFDIFESSLLYLECEKSKFSDGQEGRSFAQSTWSEEKSSILLNVDGVWKPISLADIDPATKSFKDEKMNEAFKQFNETLRSPELSMHNNFSYRKPGDERNSEATEKYIKTVFDKMNRVVPVIAAAKSVDEIVAKFGSSAAGDNSQAETIGGANAQDILKGSAAAMLSGASTVFGQGETAGVNQTANQTVADNNQNPPNPTGGSESAGNFQDILNQAAAQ